MNMENFRNVYKSDHLGVVDLEEMIESGKKLIFTIYFDLFSDSKFYY
jgi:hypothetical protein